MQELTLSQLVKKRRKINKEFDYNINTELITHINKIQLVIDHYASQLGDNDSLVRGANESLRMLHRYLTNNQK